MPKAPFSGPRNRIVNFRLTDREYEQVMAACQASGERSLSDFARLSVMANAGQPLPLHERLANLEERVLSLSAHVQRLSGFHDPE